MKILKKIKKIARSPKHKYGSSVTGNDLPLLGFHSVHGANISLSSDSSYAKRTESFCDAIVFSNRAVRVNERISIKFVETSLIWSGAIRFGFTTTDPLKMCNSLPKYACPELTSQPGNWAKALSERYSVADTVLTYYADENGKVHYSINGEDKGIYLTDVDISRPFWALLDIYGFTTAIQMIDPPETPKSNQSNNGQSVKSSGGPIYMDISSLQKANRDPLPHTYNNSNLTPLPFHRTRGFNVNLSSDGCVAERNDSHYSRGYVFSHRPLGIGEKMVIQVLKTDELYAGSLAFGLTTCNPSVLNGNDLPDDPHTLLDRPEYWIVIKDVANAPTAGDEIAFKISESGQVVMCVNRQPPITLMHVDHSQSFYAFLDLYGSTIKIKSLGSMVESQPLKPNRNTINRMGLTDCQNKRANLVGGKLTSKLIENYAFPMLSKSDPRVAETYETIHPSHRTPSRGSLSIGTECTVCYEQPINCALYTCGHMCMCYDCAFKQWKRQGAGRCPICRARIMDVIRTYYA